jgi:hypothetical protein
MSQESMMLLIRSNAIEGFEDVWGNSDNDVFVVGYYVVIFH